MTDAFLEATGILTGQPVNRPDCTLEKLLSSETELVMHAPEMRKKSFSLSLVPEIARYVSRERAKTACTVTRMSDLKPLADSMYLGLRYECSHLIALDEGGRLLSVHAMQSGTVDETPFYLRDEIASALKGGRFFIMTHNHPGGSAGPSQADIRATVRLEAMLRIMDMCLVDHCIYASKSLTSIREICSLPPLVKPFDSWLSR